MIKFGNCILVVVRSSGIEFSFNFLLLVLSCFDCRGSGGECVLGHSPSEVVMVTSSEGFVNGMFSGGFGSSRNIPGVFALVTFWCVHGAKRIWLALLVLIMSWWYVSVMLELGLQYHQIFLLIFLLLLHGALGMFDFLFQFSRLLG